MKLTDRSQLFSLSCGQLKEFGLVQNGARIQEIH